MRQETLARVLHINPQHLCRIERGERWPGPALFNRIRDVVYLSGGFTLAQCEALEAAQLRTWRAYDPSRKGKRP